jgi:hypothetical protein
MRVGGKIESNCHTLHWVDVDDDLGQRSLSNRVQSHNTFRRLGTGRLNRSWFSSNFAHPHLQPYSLNAVLGKLRLPHF